MTEIILPFGFTAYPHQAPLYNAMRSKESGGEGKKRAIAVYHRRGGKDLTCWNILIEKALEKKAVYYYVFPSYAQARKAFWDNITEEGKTYHDYVPAQLLSKKWENEMKLKLSNGSMLQVLGSDHYDAIRGTNPAGAVLSEYAYQNPRIWTAILDSILEKNGGWAIFNSTPQGKNHFYDLYEYAKTDPEWYQGLFTIDDTGLIDPRSIEKKRKQGVSEEMIQQEYYCSFSAGVIGSYYGKQIDIMEKEGRIGHVPYDRNRLVYTSFDIGYNDATSIIWFQIRGNEILIIDHYENSGYETGHYLDILRERGYNYAKHFAPHDGEAHNTTGTTYERVAREGGFTLTILKREMRIMDGIERTRGIFPRMFIDREKCEYLVKCLLQYHSEWDERAQVFRNRPKHDWCLRGDVKIRTLRGWKEISTVQAGEYVWGYSFKKKRLDIAMVTWSGKTGENAPLIEVGIDNGEAITCTPDHLFLLRNGEYRKAEELKPGDSLMPFYECLNRKYLEVDLNDGSFADEHRYVWCALNGVVEPHHHVDHIDGDHFNNDPRNLRSLHKCDHCRETFRGISNKERHTVDKTDYSRKIYGRNELYQFCLFCEKEYWGSFKSAYCNAKCRNLNKKRRDAEGLILSRTQEYKLSSNKKAQEVQKLKYQADEVYRERRKKMKRENYKKRNHCVRYIKGAKTADVYDLTVPDLGNFVAEGVVVHNSSHAADALRLLSQALPFVGNIPGGMTKEKLQEMRRKHGY